MTVQPTAESSLPPAQTLQAAREQLLAVFRREFDKASRARDATATSRFFKLFPAIGWEAEGLQAYASFVVELVKVRAPASAKSTYLPSPASASTHVICLACLSLVTTILHYFSHRPLREHRAHCGPTSTGSGEVVWSRKDGSRARTPPARGRPVRKGPA